MEVISGLTDAKILFLRSGVLPFYHDWDIWFCLFFLMALYYLEG